MISCAEFIPAYSQLFKTLERLGGKEAVESFWRCLSANFLTNLRELVTAHGLRGCWLYWSHALNEYEWAAALSGSVPRGDQRVGRAPGGRGFSTGYV
jgi:hypothetical protein